MITTEYTETLAQKLADDIAELRVNGSTVAIDSIDRTNNEVTVVSEKTFYDSHITTVELLDTEENVIYSKQANLSVDTNESVQLTHTFEVNAKEAD
ncbi:hypothetical protein [Salibacterium aidingense]|uniref:hypothetical protein n=1 Tax=Salibacterium aidingense TaxID=384933 RepID=UPI003BD957DC